MLHRVFRYVVITAATIWLNGCQCTQQCPPNDPYERFNRSMYSLNKAMDEAAIKPVAKAYSFLPKPIRYGVGNFFDNLREVTNIANDILQLRMDCFTRDTGRFLINSTFGFAGLFDVAGRVGLDFHKNDFGQTLYRWGYKQSAYLVIPLLGPSTFRDGVGFAVDYTVLSVWPWVDSKWRLILLSIDAIDTRARFFDAEEVIDTAAFDEYAFVRDAYLQRRQYLFNGEVIAEDDVDPYDEIDLSTDPAMDEQLNVENPTEDLSVDTELSTDLD